MSLANRQTNVKTSSGNVTTMSYDDVNRMIRREYASFAVTTQTYDAAGNVLLIGNGVGGSVFARCRASQWTLGIIEPVRAGG